MRGTPQRGATVYITLLNRLFYCLQLLGACVAEEVNEVPVKVEK